jgi:ribosomal protein S18 acetylase RimI-like enzyme
MPPAIRAATPADIPAISLSLAKAFHDDPIKVFLSGGKDLTTEQVLPFFDAFTRIQMPHGHVYTTPSCEAAALWSPPGQWKVPMTKVLRYTPRFLKLYGTRFIPNLSVLTDLEKLHPAEPHYYLEFVGCDPAHQGKGFGNALMEPMMERADREGVGMYLENSKEKNISFYGRFGFQVRQQMTHRRNGPSMWLMWRDPR